MNKKQFVDYLEENGELFIPETEYSIGYYKGVHLKNERRFVLNGKTIKVYGHANEFLIEYKISRVYFIYRNIIDQINKPKKHVKNPLFGRTRFNEDHVQRELSII